MTCYRTGPEAYPYACLEKFILIFSGDNLEIREIDSTFALANRN